jgi:hypothetical protein
LTSSNVFVLGDTSYARFSPILFVFIKMNA